MRVQEQYTLSKAAAASGVGLHTGVEARIVLRPAPAGSGVSFRRMDVTTDSGQRRPAEETTIPAHPDCVVDARLGVRLENAAGVAVMTVEHLMAAFALSGVDNALVEVSGNELPIFDGSAAPFMALIKQAGLRAQGAAREAIEIRAPLRVESGDRFVEVLPHQERLLDVTIDFEDAAIGRQTASFSLEDNDGLSRRLGDARTFCTLRDVEAMRAAGFSLGGSLDNALVVDGDRILNTAGLRDPNEFVLHKALDLLGDLALLGAPIYGRIRAHKPGHNLNNKLARRILTETASVERRVIPVEDNRALLTA